MKSLLAIGASFLLTAGVACAGASDKVSTGQPAPVSAGAAVDAGQLSSPSAASPASARQISGGGSAVGAGQIATAQGAAAGVAQLSPTLRSTQIAGVRGGRDRCDPTAGASAQSAECQNTLERRADQFGNNGDAAANTVQTVDPNASGSNLVNDIVNSGTGTVVVAPPH